MAYNDDYMRKTKMAREDKTQEDDRTKAYGSFDVMALTIQRIKGVYRDSPNYDSMPAYQKESLDLMATKIGRLLCGDPYDQDTWYDIVGYAKLAHDEVEKELADNEQA
jgi:hypothetical protein